MRHLVVGGAGYIGSVVARHLVEAGHEVTVVDKLIRAELGWVPQKPALEDMVSDAWQWMRHRGRGAVGTYV